MSSLSTPPSSSNSEREWKLIEKLLGQAQDEHRKARRWGIFFKLLTFGYLFIVLFMVLANRAGLSEPGAAKPHVGVVDISGMIAPDQDASADLLAAGLRRAFEAENSKAVLLRINSPGGSPVQSNQVYREITRLRALHPDKPVFAVITDVGASGAYFIASAADDIYADPASIVGSIGVIMGGFGVEEAARKLGVERRLYTSGDNKAMLDPFAPENPEHVRHVQTMLDEIHQQFIDAVRAGRGDRLNDAYESELFSGLFWTGERSLELGLVDGLKSPGQVIREVMELEDSVNYTVSRSPFEEFVRRFGMSIGAGIANSLGMESFTLR